MANRAVLLLISLVVLLTAGCCTAPPAEPAVRAFNAKPLVPEGWYEYLHEKLEDCSGESRSYGAIEWYVVKARTMQNGPTTLLGLWSAPNRIYLDERVVMSERTVGHELLHYLHRGGHGDADFEAMLARCVTDG